MSLSLTIRLPLRAERKQPASMQCDSLNEIPCDASSPFAMLDISADNGKQVPLQPHAASGKPSGLAQEVADMHSALPSFRSTRRPSLSAGNSPSSSLVLAQGKPGLYRSHTASSMSVSSASASTIHTPYESQSVSPSLRSHTRSGFTSSVRLTDAEESEGDLSPSVGPDDDGDEGAARMQEEEAEEIVGEMSALPSDLSTASSARPTRRPTHARSHSTQSVPTASCSSSSAVAVAGGFTSPPSSSFASAGSAQGQGHQRTRASRKRRNSRLHASKPSPLVSSSSSVPAVTRAPSVVVTPVVADNSLATNKKAHIVQDAPADAAAAAAAAAVAVGPQEQQTIQLTLSSHAAHSIPSASPRRQALLSVLSCVLEQLFSNPLDTLPPPEQLTAFHTERIPSISIGRYLQRIAFYAECSDESLVMSFIHISRVYHASNAAPLAGAKPAFQLNTLSIHRLLLLSVMCSAKFFDDSFYANSFYARVGGLALGELNALEVEFLALTGFDLLVATKVYRRFWAELRNPQLHPNCTCEFRNLPELSFDDQLPDSPAHDCDLHELTCTGGEEEPKFASGLRATPANFNPTPITPLEQALAVAQYTQGRSIHLETVEVKDA